MMKMADAGFLMMEKATRGAQVSMLTTWSLPRGAKDTFLRDLVAHWRECKDFAEPFNLRVKPGRVPDWERLSPDQIDMDYHLYHSGLPRPGGERELGVLASRLHSVPLDRRRPLWEMHVIEGLEGNRFALLFKLHHSQIDGMGAIRLIERVLTPEAKKRNMPAFWEVPPKAESARGSRDESAAKPADYAKLAREFLRMQFGRQQDSAALFESPKTILNGSLQMPRRVATQLYETGRLTALAKCANVTLNDVALNIAAGALRRYFLERGDLPDKTLTAGLPVSIRSDESAGNAISFIIAKLHTDIADPLQRLQSIHRSTTVAKDRFKSLDHRATREALGSLVMGPYIAQVVTNMAGRSTPVFNLIISNVPGPRETLYLNGARMEALYPISMVMDGQALNITFMTYAGHCAVGFTACREGVPHMQRIAVWTGEELEALEAALGTDRAIRPQARPRPQPRRATGARTAGRARSQS